MEFDELYNDNYVNKQLDKFINRHNNHWAGRIKKVFEISTTLLPANGSLLDLGCSIGTYAFEFAQKGYNVSGVDLSPQSIKIAQEIAKQNRISINYQVADICYQNIYKDNEFDIIYAGDIVEHLPDDLLLKTFQNCHKWLKNGGHLFIHTVPTKYDKIFFQSKFWLFLIPFSFFPDYIFKYFVHFLYLLLNFSHLVISGKTWKQKEELTVHCNLQTKKSLTKFLINCGFKIQFIELNIMENKYKNNLKYLIFKNKEYFQKDIYIMAKK